MDFSKQDVEEFSQEGNIKKLWAALFYAADADVRSAAAKAMGHLQDKRSITRLAAALGVSYYNECADKEIQVRKAAAEALGSIAHKRAVKPLVAALKDNAEPVRQVAVEALGRIGNKQAVRPLIYALSGMLNCNHAQVRKAAAEALGNIGDKRAIYELSTAKLEDIDDGVCEAAAEALHKIRDKFPASSSDNVSKRITKSLFKELTDKKGKNRLAAAHALHILGETKWRGIITGNGATDYAELMKTDDTQIQKRLAYKLNKADFQAMRCASESNGNTDSITFKGNKFRALKSLGTLFLAFSIISLLFVIASVYGISPVFSAPKEMPDPVPGYIPHNVPLGADELEIDNESISYIIPSGKTIILNVSFEEGESINALWRGTGAKLVTDAGDAVAARTQTTSWPELLITTKKKYYDFTPWIKAEFSANDENRNSWLEISAEMDLIYPVSSFDGYTDENEHIKRVFRVFVVSPGDYDLLVQNQLWLDAENATKRIPGFIITSIVLVSLIASGIFFIILYRRLYLKYVLKSFRPIQ